MQIILASQSPRRKELLAELVPSFLVCPADIDETVLADETPFEYVKRMAVEKAAAVAIDFPDALVIASDTTVVIGGDIYGKPTSRADAFRMIRAMSGQTHEVHTAVILQNGAQQVLEVASAAVTFFELSESEIEAYLDHNDYRDKAGSYAIQGAAKVFVKKIEGDFYSIVGFPIGLVHQMLKRFDLN